MRSRAETRVLWESIKNGILRHPFSTEDESGEKTVLYEHARACDFIESVAAQILEADKSGPRIRDRQILKAVGLEGRLNANELEIRKALQIHEDFKDSHLITGTKRPTEVQKTRTLLNLYRSLLFRGKRVYMGDRIEIRRIKEFQRLQSQISKKYRSK